MEISPRGFLYITRQGGRLEKPVQDGAAERPPKAVGKKGHGDRGPCQRRQELWVPKTWNQADVHDPEHASGHQPFEDQVFVVGALQEENCHEPKQRAGHEIGQDAVEDFRPMRGAGQHQHGRVVGDRIRLENQGGKIVDSEIDHGGEGTDMPPEQIGIALGGIVDGREDGTLHPTTSTSIFALGLSRRRAEVHR